MYRLISVRTVIPTLLALLLLMALFGIGSATTPEPETDPAADEAAAGEMWEMLQEVDYQENWSTVPGKGTMYRGQGPHGMLLSTYLNDEAVKGMESKPGTMPQGAIVVKENYMPDETLAAVTVMAKQAGYDPGHNDWFYASFGPEGEVQAAGSPPGCVSCHGAVWSNDYLFTFPIAPAEVEGGGPATDEDLNMAEDLWKALEAADYQGTWSTIPGKETFYKGQGPHGMLLSTYVNAEAAEAMQSQPGIMPEGAVIVKKNYMPDETLVAVTVMVKEAGYDPDHNDWFWAKFGPDGEVQVAGLPGGCLSCHGAVMSNDYVFTFPVAPLKAEAAGPADEVTVGNVDLTPPDIDVVSALVRRGGCGGCHVIPVLAPAGGALGPSWCEPAEEFQAGEEDLAWLYESIVDPNAEVEADFPANIMPQNFGEFFAQEELDTLVAFIATLECEE